MVGITELTQERKKSGGFSTASGGDDEDIGLIKALGFQRTRWLWDPIKTDSFHVGWEAFLLTFIEYQLYVTSCAGH